MRFYWHSNASRASEIHALDIRYLSRNKNGVTFTIAELTKTTQPGKRVNHYLPLKQEGRLCPIVALEEYLKRTSPIRRKDTSKDAAIPVGGKTFPTDIQIKCCSMDEIIDPGSNVGEQISAHFIRGAASIAAVMKGMSISEVLCIADWSSDNVFKMFYFKPTDTRPQSLLNTIIDNDNN